MAWLLPTLTGVLALVVLALAVLTLRLRSRVDRLERRPGPESDAVAAPRSASDGTPLTEPAGQRRPPLAPEPEFVITRVGEPVPPVPAEPSGPVPTVPAPVFADLVLKETVVQTASLAHGLRRALSPETRNRIRFHARQEVKRSRKQRRAELREVRREWAARQRTGSPRTGIPNPEESAA
jgi:hypothetical protein